MPAPIRTEYPGKGKEKDKNKDGNPDVPGKDPIVPDDPGGIGGNPGIVPGDGDGDEEDPES